VTPSYQAGDRLERDLRRLRLPVVVGGAVLLAASVAGAFFSPRDFFHSYLLGFLFWIDLTLGSMGFLMVHYLTGGAWGVVTRRTMEAVTRTLPVLAILFIPIGVGLGSLYDWARPGALQHSQLLRHRSGYMNPAFFLARAAIYLAGWIVFAYFLNRWSVEQDRYPGHNQRRLAKLSAGGLVFYLFSASFAAVDWAESLEPRWSSTMWGFLFIAAEGLGALAFVIIVLTLLTRRDPMSGVLKPDHFHDLGKMLFANLMLWSYFAFCQYLIVWSANLPDEISYYLPRTGTTWGWLGVSLIVMLFLFPMLLLLSSPLKRRPYLLSGVAVLILAMQYMDVVWIVAPSYYKQGFRIQWMDVLTPFGIGGVWLWAFLRELPRYPLMPVNAPELEMALVHESE
jgi:hypothetical protein